MPLLLDNLYTEIPRLLLRLAALVALAGITIVTVNYVKVLSLRRRLPPGPFPLPIVGNHYHIPHPKPWIKFEEWSRQYDNPMITIWLGSKPVIVLNDAWTASDLLEKRADIYSSRPHMIAMGDLINATETNQTTLVYGDRWRLHRKLTVSSLIPLAYLYAHEVPQHSVVGSQAVRNYRSFQGDESKILTQDLLADPDDYVMSIERYSVSTVSIVGWGRRISRKNDYVAQKALEGMEAVNLIIPGYLLLESLPVLAKLPSWLYRLPAMLRAHSSANWAYFYALSKESAAAPGAPASFARTLLREQRAHGLGDVEVAALATNLVGGIPHAPLRDDEYRGYRIPRGTQITCNVWAIHRHPREFPEPDVVVPERYLGGLKFEYPNSRGHNAFGWGRRQCSGQPLAEQSLFMVVARLLWAFRVEPGLDENVS